MFYIKKFKRIFAGFLTGISLFTSNTFAGGENKIVYFPDQDKTKLFYISTENIPKVVRLFHLKYLEYSTKCLMYEERKFSNEANVAFKFLTAAVGVAAAYGISRIKNKGAAIAAGLSCGLAISSLFFIPEYISCALRSVKNYRDNFVDTDCKLQNRIQMIDGLAHVVNRGETGLESLMSCLVRIRHDKGSIRQWIDRDHACTFTTNNLAFTIERFADCYLSENNEGIVMRVRKERFCNGIEVAIFRQGDKFVNEDGEICYLSPGFIMSEGSSTEIVPNQRGPVILSPYYNSAIKTVQLLDFDKFLDEFFKC